MSKTLNVPKTFAALFAFLLLAANISAQKKIPPQDISELLKSNLAGMSMSSADLANMRISNTYFNKHTGTTLVYLQQTYKAIDVYNAIKVLAFKDGKLVSATGGRVSKMAARVNNAEGVATITPGNAVNAAAAHLGLAPATSAVPLTYNTGDKLAVFGNLGIASDNIKAMLLWLPVDKGHRVKLAWQVQIAPSKTVDHWLIRVDAATGTVINKDNLTVKCNWTNPAVKDYTIEHYNDMPPAAPQAPPVINSAGYRVVPYPVEAPSFSGGTPSVATNPWLLSPAGSNATTLKWNDDGTTSYAITRGNNVYAQEDHDNDDNTFGAPGKSKTALPDLLFDYNPAANLDAKDSLKVGLALTNLFYWNNIMHDLTYQYGFDEVAGNFQATNLGRGGAGGDYVIADGQDAGGINNANFATLEDGVSPRMQMYLWNYDTNAVKVNSPSALAGYKYSAEGAVSNNNSLASLGPITGDVVLYKDASGNDSACNAAANKTALAGKIALVYRGGCNFVAKIKNAQAAGAIAVIVVNSQPGGQVLTMSGSDNTITIPAVMITYEDGNAIKASLAANNTVNVTLKSRLNDGDLDDGIISHEYTHGISNRLTGGPAAYTCLQNAEQMGEGWSDYNALMTTTNWATAQLTDGAKGKTLGTYVLDEVPTGRGIRTYPYSTDMSVDPWTYDMLASIPNGEVHVIGEIWTSVLWDMTWKIIAQDGKINTNFFDASAAGGNSVAMKLVTEGMKLQRCSPGFIDGRDAILKADTLLYGAKYSCTIWKAFARRGMGVNASQGSSDSYTDQVADYSTPASAIVIKHVDKDSAVQNEQLTYTVTATCQCVDISGFKIVDTLPKGVTYISGGTYNAANRTVTFSGINLAASQNQQYTIKVSVNNTAFSKPVLTLNDSINSSTLNADLWKNESASGNTWQVSSIRTHTGTYSYVAGDSAKAQDETLVSTKSYLLSGISILSFWHYYDVEAGYDGGIVEISTDSGATWTDLGPYMTLNGYNGSIDPANATVLSGKNAFTGSSNGAFINTSVNLTAFTGKKVMFRFVFASDVFEGVDGWYIDDITLRTVAGVYNQVRLFNNAGTLQSTSDTLTYIRASALAVTWGNFTAVKVGDAAHLAWSTLQELNTGSYIVERSSDGTDFYTIGIIKAAGNSTAATSYAYTDETPLQGNNYYRIKQVDKNGSFTHSPVRVLVFSGLTGKINITPNPATDRFAVTVTGNSKPLTISLINNAGQRVGVYNMQGQYSQFALPAVAAGVYYVRIEGQGVASLQKLLVK
jgi:extracellular elastinolytic metalloproteinase